MVRAPAAHRKPACGACRGPVPVRAPGPWDEETSEDSSNMMSWPLVGLTSFGGGILVGCLLDSIEAPVRSAVMSKVSSLGTALFAAPLITFIWWPWTSSAVGDPCKVCVDAPPATCAGTSPVTCLGSGCDYCSSGCATIGNLAAKQCAEVASGGYTGCYPQYTPCATFSKEAIHPCNIVCMCDVWTTYYAECPGAFQTGCNLTVPCDPVNPEPGLPT